MKIVFVLPGSGLSGGVRVTMIAANGLIERGHHVRMLCRKTPFSMKEAIKNVIDNKNVKMHDWLNDFGGEIEYYENLASTKYSVDEIIVGVGMWASNELNRLSHLKNNKVQYIHGATPWDPQLMKRALESSLPKIMVANYLRPISESYGGINISAVIPNGIDTSEYYCSIDESEKNGIGTIYSSSGAKDPDTIIALLNRLMESQKHVPVRIFGTEKKPRALRGCLYSRTPSIREARDIYSRCSVWILASMSEGFPAPVLEAMACGCTVVATDCGGTRDMIKDGENGFLVPVGDVKQILDKVMVLLTDHKLRNRFRLNSMETVKAFTWERSINMLEATLASL
jgi:glycosyltransferase involved in cell wall biosynthesis